jgi:Flp pilus assembly pilin Flp
MMDTFRRLAITFAADTRGVTLVEYGIAISLAIIIGGGAIALLAGDVSATFGLVGSSLPN